MDLQLKTKTAFISGSTRGIGFAIAKRLLEEGANVIINGRNEKTVNMVVKKLTDEFPHLNISGLVADFSKPDEVAGLIEQLPKIHILINNVGIFEQKDFTEITDQDWYSFFEINVMSGIRLSKAILPSMLSNNDGRIIFISSESAVKVPANMIHYAMTKTAMVTIARGLSELTRNSKVTINTILGGPTYSDGVADAVEKIAATNGQEVESFKTTLFHSINPNSILQRFIDPIEIANLAVYLASPLAIATNGTALRADGGVLQTIL